MVLQHLPNPPLGPADVPDRRCLQLPSLSRTLLQLQANHQHWGRPTLYRAEDRTVATPVHYCAGQLSTIANAAVHQLWLPTRARGPPRCSTGLSCSTLCVFVCVLTLSALAAVGLPPAAARALRAGPAGVEAVGRNKKEVGPTAAIPMGESLPQL